MGIPTDISKFTIFEGVNGFDKTAIQELHIQRELNDFMKKRI